jgi:hypothetical protein
MRLSKIVGITLFFLGVGLWVFVIMICIISFFSLVVPTVILAFCAGLCTNTFRKSKPWPEFRKLTLWRYARKDLFNFVVEGNKESVRLLDFERSELGRSRNHKLLFAIYPHGHFSLTAAFFFGLDPDLAHITGCVHSVLFWLPVVGSLVGWLGCTTVTESDMKAALNKKGGGRIFMCPGGVADMANTGNTVKKREGFLRVARDTATTVIPVWCPQERTYYQQWLPFGTRLQKYLFFPVPMFLWGRWWCPLMPRYVEKSRVILGAPIRWTDTQGQKDELISLKEGSKRFWKEIENMQDELDAKACSKLE